MRTIQRFFHHNITSIVIAFAVLAVGFAALPAQTSYAASAKDEVCAAIGSCDANSDKKISGVFASVINILSAIVGAVAVIMIVIGGFRYIVSAGDSNSVGGAKNTIIYALVGLVIVGIAQIIVKFILERT